MSFEKLEIRLRELYDIKIYTDNSQNENYKPVKAEFNEVFLNLVKASVTEKKFFSGSPLDLFIIALQERIEIVKQEEIDFDENEYIIKIYHQQCNLFSSKFKNNELYYYIPYLNIENSNLFRSIIKKRINYIVKLLFKKGIEVIVTYPNGDTSIIKKEFKKHINIMVENDSLQPLKQTLEILPEIDLSDSNAVQKIIYLNELGIIDLLKKEPCFATSVNNLAKVITAITGEKHTTIQPYLNVLINNTGHENNNPYKTNSTVEKVKNQLLYLGVKPK